MRVVLFRTRLAPDIDATGYSTHAGEMYELARQIPGFVSSDFTAEDGTRMAVIMFRDDESLAKWRNHPLHRQAQERGRQEYYDSYQLLVCDLLRESTFARSKS